MWGAAGRELRVELDLVKPIEQFYLFRSRIGTQDENLCLLDALVRLHSEHVSGAESPTSFDFHSTHA